MSTQVSDHPHAAHPRARKVLSLACATAPFVFAAIRALHTGRDLRMLWMAVASVIGAALVWGFDRTRKRPLGVWAGSALTLGVATLLAAVTAYLQRAHAAAGVWPVALVFGLCWAAAYRLAAR